MGGTQASASARLLHIVDGDHATRAQIAMTVVHNGGHAEIYEDIGELISVKPANGALLTKAPDSNISMLLATLHTAQIFLPVILFSDNPTPTQVVRAVHGGIADYLAWPFSGEELIASCDYCQTLSNGNASEMRRRQKAQTIVEGLSQRERQILAFMIDGHSNKSMAISLDLSPRTIEDYRLNCLQKLGVNSSSAAIRIGLEAGLHLR